MHPTAIHNCQAFFDTYAASFPARGVKVIEIGSQDVNGSLRSTCPPAFEYLGVDFVAGKGVDLVLTDPYQLPFEDASADILLSSSCFEHSEMFWLVFLEVMRVLKPHGLFYLNAPSNGAFHRYPVDCWRFYPDSGRALVTWARRNGVQAELLESYISTQNGDIWNDFVGIFLKDAGAAARYPRRILDGKQDVSNGLRLGSDEFAKPQSFPEDIRKLQVIGQVASGALKVG